MGNAIGLTTALMTGVETTYGTPVALTRSFEIDSESLDFQKEVIRSDALRSGTRGLRRGSRRAMVARSGAGDIVMQVTTNGMGRWFQQALGGTSSIAQVGATPAWLQTHTMGSLEGKSQTIQKQLRDQANALKQQFTFHGAKVATMNLAVSKKGVLVATFGIDAEDVDTATAAGTPSYVSTSVYHWGQGSLSLGGTATAGLVSGGTLLATVTEANVMVDNHLNIDEFFMNGTGLKSEPVEDDYPEVTGSFKARFASIADFYTAFRADSALALSLSFAGGVIGGGESEALIISLPEIRLLGEAPKVGGAGVVEVTVPFEAQYDGTNVGMRLDYKSSDTSI